MPPDLPPRKLTALRGVAQRSVSDTQQRRRFLEGEDLWGVLAQHGTAEDETVVCCEVVADRIFDELAFGPTRRARGGIQSLGLVGGKSNVKGNVITRHIARISSDIFVVVNLLTPSWDAEIDVGDGTILRATRLAKHAGAHRLAANLYELEPGAVVSPLHFHHRNEELLFVISGTPSLRRSDAAIRELSPGEVIAFPAGPAGAHQIVNRSEHPARVLICATDDLPEVAEQTETDRLAIITETGLRVLPREPTLPAP